MNNLPLVRNLWEDVRMNPPFEDMSLASAQADARSKARRLCIGCGDPNLQKGCTTGEYEPQI